MSNWEWEGRRYRLFLDLDGVLADFDKGVRSVLGKNPADLPEKEMWPVLAKTKDFYADLEWMSDGRALWDSVRRVEPTIVSGVPWGHWAEAQKRAWCRRELGPEVPVILCKSKEKGRAAAEFLGPDEIPVLIDDRLGARQSWLDIGGLFILHVTAEASLGDLAQLGFDKSG